MNQLAAWISALRLRTLPLAAASVILAAGLAIQAQIFNGAVFCLSLLTALLLQILSNLANDYGDAQTGADNKARVGPMRAMQTGLISQSAMKKAIYLTTLLCLISGISLLLIALGDDLRSWLLFILLGFLAIVAAITYTMGKLPYGYRAMGDLAVFIFFGLLGVIGSYYLYNQTFNGWLLLPACSVGMLSAAVLNINNIRDMHNDKQANKTTLVVLVGRRPAFIYHLFLLVMAPLLASLYLLTLDGIEAWQFIFLLVFIPLLKSACSIHTAIKKDLDDGLVFNRELKNTAQSTFLFSLSLTLLLIIGQ